MRAADTNLLVRLLVRDDVAQAQASAGFVEPGAWISHLVLAEVLWVLAAVYRRTPAQIATAVEWLLQHESLSIQEDEVVVRALEDFRARPALGFSDCLVLEIARKAGHLPLGTFDRTLAQLPGTQAL